MSDKNLTSQIVQVDPQIQQEILDSLQSGSFSALVVLIVVGGGILWVAKSTIPSITNYFNKLSERLDKNSDIVEDIHRDFHAVKLNTEQANITNNKILDKLDMTESHIDKLKDDIAVIKRDFQKLVN